MPEFTPDKLDVALEEFQTEKEISENSSIQQGQTLP